MKYRLALGDLDLLQDVVQAHRDEEAAGIARNEMVIVTEHEDNGRDNWTLTPDGYDPGMMILHAALGPLAEGALSRFAGVVDM